MKENNLSEQLVFTKNNNMINKQLSDLEIMKELFPIHKLINKYFDKIYKKFNINQIQFEVLYLLYVNRSQEIKMSLLGDKLDMARSGVTLLVDKMALEGLIIRCPCSEDRRIINVMLTQKGRKIMTDFFPSNDVFKASTLDFMKKEEKEFFLELIFKIKEKLENDVKLSY